MVLDPIPQSLPVHFFGSRPQAPTSRSVSERDYKIFSKEHYAARSVSWCPVVREKEMWTSEYYAARQFFFFPLCVGKRWWYQKITQREVCFCFPLCVRKRCGDIRILRSAKHIFFSRVWFGIRNSVSFCCVLTVIKGCAYKMRVKVRNLVSTRYRSEWKCIHALSLWPASYISHSYPYLVDTAHRSEWECIQDLSLWPVSYISHFNLLLVSLTLPRTYTGQSERGVDTRYGPE